MLRIFRKLRNTMVSKGKVQKYLLYAIGEILLVMIGILLALQVNNWNENRKKSLSETHYLKSLASDFKEQSRIIDGLIGDQVDKFIFHADQAIDLLESNAFVEKLDSINILLQRCSNTRTFSVIDATYEELKSTGNLQILKDTSIKNQLILTYKLIEEQDKMFAKNNAFIEQYFSSYFRRNEGRFYEDAEGKIKSKLVADPEFKFTLLGLFTSRKGVAMSHVVYMETIQENLAALIKKIGGK